MPFQSTTLMAAATTALLATTARAHVTMKNPVPYSVDKLDNSPITASQFPCKKQNGFEVSTMNEVAVGDQINVELEGSAVHGGGSCQLSVTMDTEPTENSVFKVIKSMEGGCPGVQGQAGTYDVTLPDSIPNGEATFAWTWFSKLSGAPEMYMNCAPIKVSGGADDDSKFNELPDMFVANLGEGCTTAQNFATKFPNAGENVEDGGTDDLEAPEGECGASGGSGGGDSGSPAAPSPSSPAGGGAESPVASPPAEGAPTSAAGEEPAAPSNPGGVFAPGASSAASGAPTSTLTTMVTVTAAPSAQPPSQGTGSPAQPSPPSQGTGSPAQPSSPPSSGGGSGGSGTCSEDGAIVCNGESQFGICNNGEVVWQEVAAGTTCSNGSIQKRGYNGRIARPRRAVVVGKPFEPSDD